VSGRRLVLTSAMLVAGLRLWAQLRGKTKTPFGEWAVGWGVVFFFIALISEAYPQPAGALAGIVVVGDFLANGAQLFEDMTAAISGGAGFVAAPFGGASAASVNAATGASSAPAQATAQQVNTATGATASGHGASLGGPSAAQVNVATGVGR
jgi:hypothetical protein